ncbi:FG-GAP-like repeat-containing protein [Micromonospora sp. B11E3]|uniref:FG-GAP-like repeat-containing protein n=1 Tax=Micromonospora sp. B11E3 TaxID=3153562 RepID=UPI00325E963A
MHKKMLVAGVCAAALLGVTAVAPTASAVPGDTAAKGNRADFNGDGYPDLAVSSHSAPAGDVKRAGVVAIVYGSPAGLRYDTASIVSKDTPGVPGDAAADETWRAVDGFGDLDGDGYDDLVITYGDDPFTVLWGSANGITGAGTAIPPGDFTPTSPKLFGRVGVGDVNGDGFDDIISYAQGGEPWIPEKSSSGISVLLGPIDRSTGEPAFRWYRDTAKLDDLWTHAVYVADLTGDGIDDIAVSGIVPQAFGKTAWTVLKGSPTGLVKGSAWAGPHSSTNSYPSGTGDLNGDGYADLVAGFPYLSQVYVVYGGPDGISSTRAPRSYTQASSGVPGIDEAGDRFGSAVAVGDTDQDGYDDVVIGASYETGSDPATTTEAGAITMLRGSATGITTTGAKSFTQNASGMPSTSENDDHFGATVEIIDTDGNGSPEVYVGGNGEDGYRGRVWKLLSDATGVTGTGATSFQLGTLGGPTGGNFGAYMAG